MRVVITKAAKADLIRIEAFIRPHNPVRAETFVDELLDRCLALKDMPRAYPVVQRFAKWEVRRCVHHDYLIFYRIQDTCIEVIRILNGAQEYERMLFPEL